MRWFDWLGWIVWFGWIAWFGWFDWFGWTVTMQGSILLVWTDTMVC